MKTFSIILTAILFHARLAFAAGCDLPRFGGARLFAAMNNATLLGTGDFNHDGFIDVALGGPNTGGVTGIAVLLSNGDGTFQPPVYYSVAASSSILVMLGNGDGTFKAGIRTAVSANRMAVGDFNGDGKPDLVLSENISILLGKGDGTFQAPITTTGSGFGGPAVGDFNGDGKLDVVSPTASGGVLVMLGDGTGRLGPAVNFSTGGGSPGTLAVSDLNGDRKLDVVSFNSVGKTISVLLGNGSGGFQTPMTYAVGGAQSIASSLLVADLTGDGKPDIAVAFQGSFTDPGPTVSVFPGVGDGTFQPAVQYSPVAQNIWAMAAGDFNGDGQPDLLFTSSSDLPSQVGVIFGAADGTLQSPRSYTVGPTPGQAVLANLNGDGVLDMVAPATGTGGNLSVLLGNGDGSFQPAVSYPAAAGAQYVAVGDFNGDGKPDLAVSNFSPTTFTFNLLIFLGNGDGTFRAPLVTAVMNDVFLVVGDFNKDGKLDASVGGQVLLGNGDGTFRASFASVAGPSVTVDLNGDGNLDMVGNGNNGVAVQLGNGDGTFRAPVTYSTGRNGGRWRWET